MQTLNLQTIRKAQSQLLLSHKKALQAVKDLQINESDFKVVEQIITNNFNAALATVIEMHKTGNGAEDAEPETIHFDKSDAAITGKLAPAAVLNEKNEDVF